MRATVFGAGNIGRGLVGAVLADSGYSLTYIDVNSDLVSKLNDEGAFTLATDEGSRTISIAGAIDARDGAEAIEAVAGADLVATAVGAPILAVVAPTVGAGLLASQQEHVNVIACENIHPNSGALRNHVAQTSGAEAVEGVGFPNVVVDRIVPGDPGSLELFAESSFEFVVATSDWAGPFPESTPIVFTDRLDAYKLRKLWLVNGLHVLTAWLGLDRGHQFVHTAISDPEILALVESASKSASVALAAETEEFDPEGLAAYAERSLRRFSNPMLADATARVARNPLMKLGANERVVAPAKAAAERGLDLEGFAAGIAAALCLRDSAIGGVDELVAAIGDQGWRRLLIEGGGLNPEGALLSEIEQLMPNDNGSKTMLSEDVLIENPAGLHARPAAEIVEQAKVVDATVHIKKGEKVADAKSIMSVLALGANTGDTVTIVAEGNDAETALDALRQIMKAAEH